MAWTPDGKQVLSASYDKTMKLWDATAGTMVRAFKGYDEKTFPKGHRDQVFCARLYEGWENDRHGVERSVDQALERGGWVGPCTSL